MHRGSWGRCDESACLPLQTCDTQTQLNMCQNDPTEGVTLIVDGDCSWLLREFGSGSISKTNKLFSVVMTEM